MSAGTGGWSIAAGAGTGGWLTAEIDTASLLKETGEYLWENAPTGREVVEYLVTAGEQAILGDYAEDKNVLGTIGQIGSGFLPVVGAIADVRDLVYDVTHFDGSWQGVLYIAADVIAVGSNLAGPIGGLAGDLAKGGIKGVAKSLGRGAKTVGKLDDVVDGARGVGKLDDAKRLRRADDQLDILNNPRCFAPETPIATPDGPRPIGEVRRGDRVLAFDHRAGAWAPRAVDAFHENIYDGPLFTIATESGTIRATIYHPFWVLDGLDLGERATPRELDDREDQGLALPGRWVNSHELRCGDLLIGRDGRPRPVLRVAQEPVSGFLTHNLTVDDDHTFAVGADAVLVHNTSDCSPGSHAPKSVSATFTIAQLEKKWKHAGDFGITTTKRNPATLAQYQRAIVSHLDDVATIEKGTYIYVKDSKVFLNPNTNLVVVLDKDGLFVTGWKLTPGTPQWTKLINDGVLR